jgi:hypothetical protein
MLCAAYSRWDEALASRSTWWRAQGRKRHVIARNEGRPELVEVGQIHRPQLIALLAFLLPLGLKRRGHLVERRTWAAQSMFPTPGRRHPGRRLARLA